MRFDHLYVGQRFFHASSLKSAGLFEKKSKTSAYTLHPVSRGRCKLDGYHRGIVGFSGCVEVYPLLEQRECGEWSGTPDPSDPDNFWVDDKTEERVNAETGERTTEALERMNGTAKTLIAEMEQPSVPNLTEGCQPGCACRECQP